MRRPAPPSGSRSAYCLTLPKAVLNSLGECRDQVPGDPPAALDDLARHRASNFPITLSRQSLFTTCDDLPLNAKHCPAAPSSTPGTLPTMRHQLGLSTIDELAATNQQRFGTHSNFGAYNVTLMTPNAMATSAIDRRGYDTSLAYASLHTSWPCALNKQVKYTGRVNPDSR